MVILQVLESWDAAEDSDEEREKAATAAAAKAKADAEAAAHKKSKTQRIEQHQQERRKQKEREEEEEEEESDSEDEAERRARMRRTEKESDLKHAEDLFGDIDINRTKARSAPRTIVIDDDHKGGGVGDPSKAVDLSAMQLFKPTTKDQFTKLTNTLIPLLLENSKKPQFTLWAQDFTKQLLRGLNSAEVKKVSSSLTTMSNEKMREERASDKGTKKTKAAKTKVSLAAGGKDDKETTAYDDDGLGDDDFM